jgi:rhodanese-related sulfurtransferase
MQKDNKQQKIFIFGFLLMIVVIFWFLLKPFVLNWKNGQKNDAEKKANEEILKAPSIMPEELFSKIENKSEVFLIDISSANDFSRGHIAKSINSPAEKLDKKFFTSIGASPTADIFIFSQGGDLANLATIVNRIISQGFSNAKYLRGGISDWREKGFPLVSSGGTSVDSSKVKKLTAEEAIKIKDASPSLIDFIDVRDKNIFSGGHIEGAKNIPLSELEGRKNEVSAIKKVIVYGSSDSESFQAAVVLFDLNFFNVYQLDGGLGSWKAAGGKVE